MLWKDNFKTITHSWGRFISIFCLIFLGVFSLVGLKVTGPNMRQTAENFYAENQLADVSIMSTYGLNESDQGLISSIENLNQIEFGYFTDVVIKETDISVRVFSATEELSRYELVEGKMPNNENEIALDYELQDQYKIGDVIEFSLDGDTPLTNSQTEVVGFVKSSEFTNRVDLGPTSVGTGQLTTYGVVTPDNFETDVYMIARINFEDTQNLDAYSDEYRETMAVHLNRIETLLKDQPEARLAAIKVDARVDIDEAEAELVEAEADIVQAEIELDQVQLSIDEAREALELMKQGYIPMQSGFEAEIDANEVALEEAKDELQNAKEDVREASLALQEAKDELDALDMPIYTINDRNDDMGFYEYLENSQRIDVLANVFPVFLFAIAALVSLTTMTRMVDEERINMGSLKALGYSKKDILKKFVFYGLVTGVSGTLVGAVVGHTLLPYVIFQAYAAMFTFSSLHYGFYLNYTLIALIVSVLCTVVSAIAVALKELDNKPASLLSPKAPKNGKRIALERVTPLWKRLSFKQKVTARNLFRYKKRMFMTVFGIAGCMALLITGFGIRDSISSIVEKQFDSIIHYDLIAVTKDFPSAEELDSLRLEISNHLNIHDYLDVRYEKMHAVGDLNHITHDVSLLISQDETELKNFVSLHERGSGDELSLNDGVIMTEKLTQILDVEVGDWITLYDDNNQEHHMLVSGITEMFAGHYVFMSTDSYEEIFNQASTDNAILITLTDFSQEALNEISTELMDLNATKGVIQTYQVRQMIDNIIDSLSQVIYVIVACAIMLAMVVMFNLTNINVSERIRELSTIKVLGFYPGEVTMYIYRETLILTLFGILAGYVGGFFLHAFIIKNLPPDFMMFSPDILLSNYVTSAIITLVISIGVMIVMHRKLKKVDMLEALKSVE